MARPRRAALAAAMGFFCALAASADEPPGFTPEMLDSLDTLPGDLAPLPAPVPPADNPQTEAKVKLGRQLFFDKGLSKNRKISCATCHDPAQGFADGQRRSLGVLGKRLPRHTPTVVNAAYAASLFVDGRAATLEEQAKGPILNPDEMGMTAPLVQKRLKRYRAQFRKVFGRPANIDDAARAIAAFERTLVTHGSPFDRYAAGDKSALDDRQKRGLVLFVGKAACSQCHLGANFSDDKFHSLGTEDGDTGRFVVTSDEADRGAFRTPSLRNVAETAPYLHDGSLATLAEVIELYDRGGGTAQGKSKLLFPLGLTPEEKSDLEAFLLALSGSLEARRR